jgi:hypothetical protein
VEFEAKLVHRPQGIYRGFLSARAGLLNVRYWPKADMTSCTAHVRFRGKADMTYCTANICL